MDGSPDEQQTTCGDQRASVVLATSVTDAARREFGKLTERNPPGELSRRQVNSGERAPGCCNSRVSLWIQPPAVARESVGLVGRREVRGACGKVGAVVEKGPHGIQRLLLQVRERGHASATLAYARGELGRLHAGADAAEGRKLRW